MFYDERIENVKGRISRNAILMSFIISLVLGGIHIANIIRNDKYLWFASLEIAICIETLAVLIIGFVIGKLNIKDERTEYKQNRFYNKSAKYLITSVLVIFALVWEFVINIGKPMNFADQGFGGILYVLFFIVGIYVVYSFKRNDIYFNYSIMDSDNYYTGVFKNIKKMALYALFLLALAVTSLAVGIMLKNPNISFNIANLLYTVVCFAASFFELSALYLLYSFLEKSSYNSENSMSKSTIISLGIAIFIYAVYTAGVIFIDALPISQTFALQLVSVISTLDAYIKFALLIFLTYFGYEYQRSRENKLLSVACMVLLLGEVLSVFLGKICSGLIFVFMPEIMSHEAYIINQILSSVNVFIDDALSIAKIVGISLIIFSLVKDRFVHKVNRLAVVVLVVLGGVELFLRTQVDYLTVNIYRFIVEIAVLCYIAALVARVGKRTNKELQ